MRVATTPVWRQILDAVHGLNGKAFIALVASDRPRVRVLYDAADFLLGADYSSRVLPTSDEHDDILVVNVFNRAVRRNELDERVLEEVEEALSEAFRVFRTLLHVDGKQLPTTVSKSQMSDLAATLGSDLVPDSGDQESYDSAAFPIVLYHRPQSAFDKLQDDLDAEEKNESLVFKNVRDQISDLFPGVGKPTMQEAQGFVRIVLGHIRWAAAHYGHKQSGQSKAEMWGSETLQRAVGNRFEPQAQALVARSADRNFSITSEWVASGSLERGSIRYGLDPPRVLVVAPTPLGNLPTEAIALSGDGWRSLGQQLIAGMEVDPSSPHKDLLGLLNSGLDPQDDGDGSAWIEVAVGAAKTSAYFDFKFIAPGYDIAGRKPWPAAETGCRHTQADQPFTWVSAARRVCNDFRGKKWSERPHVVIFTRGGGRALEKWSESCSCGGDLTARDAFGRALRELNQLGIEVFVGFGHGAQRVVGKEGRTSFGVVECATPTAAVDSLVGRHLPHSLRRTLGIYGR